jgi:hypothetical protein
MQDGSTNQSSSDNPDSGEEKWISTKEVLKIFPISGRTLKHWRDTKQIKFKTIRKRSFYIESNIRLRVEEYSQPKKFLGMRKSSLEKKLRSIDIVLGIGIVVFLFWFVTKPLNSSDPYTFKDISFGFKMILGICVFYGFLRLVIFLWKKFFRKKKPDM